MIISKKSIQEALDKSEIYNGIKNTILCIFWATFLISLLRASGDLLIELVSYSEVMDLAKKLNKPPQAVINMVFGYQIYCYGLMISIALVFSGVMYGARPSKKEKDWEDSIPIPRNVLVDMAYGTWCAGIVAVMTGVLWLVYITSGPLSLASSANELNGLEALTIGILSYCMYRKSMTAAVLFMGYYVMSTSFKIFVQHQINGLIIATSIFILWFSWIGVLGSFRYKNIVWKARYDLKNTPKTTWVKTKK